MTYELYHLPKSCNCFVNNGLFDCVFTCSFALAQLALLCKLDEESWI